jgi:hypothetical protein
MEHNYHSPPMPVDPVIASRWRLTGERVRLLKSDWKTDLEDLLIRAFGLQRREAMGPASTSKNTFKRVCEELSSLYTETPRPRHALGGEMPGFLTPVYIDTAGQAFDASMIPRDRLDRLVSSRQVTVAHPGIVPSLWPLMRRAQVMALGCREVLVMALWSDSAMAPNYTLHTPDTFHAEAAPDAPSTPIRLRLLEWHTIEGKGRWCWRVYDISNSSSPTMRIEEFRQDNIRPRVFQALTGPDYPYRWTSGPRAGMPYIPGELYHAEETGQLFDPTSWRELVEATYDVACAWTFWLHTVFRASWPQRYGVNVYVAGTQSEGAGDTRRTNVPADPTTMLHLESDGQGQPMVGQWAPAADVKTLQEAIAAFENSLVAIAGVDGANIVRESGDAWSGAALSISRDGKREAMKHYGPQFRPRDVCLIEKIAALSNLARRAGKPGALGFEVPESGYRQNYTTLPLSPQELKARQEHNAAMVAAGRMSQVDAYQDEHPGTTREEAIDALRRIASDNLLFPPPAAPSVSTTPTPAK